MARTYTNAEIAADYRLWMTYADTGANDSEETFNAWTIDERVAMLTEMFGPDSHTPEEN